MKKLLSGNEAIALGAYHAGVVVATAYPGTPSTEILENIARMDGVYAEWSTNEKVALEVGMGASYGGVRALVSMKHVGLNVAADPFFAVSTTGVVGGLVIVSCDDPGEHSSQGEQDNRHFARIAKVPMLEPTDSQEAYELMDWAFSISEEFDTPVLLRSTTRISHCKTVVDVTKERKADLRQPGFIRSPEKYVMVPSNARVRRHAMEERIKKLQAYVEDFPLNQMLLADRRLGVISDGVAYQYAREVFSDASHLKLTTIYPIPANLIRRFAREVERVVVVEELDPYLEDEVRRLGIAVTGKEFIPIIGELNPEIVEDGAIQAGLLSASPKPPPKSRRPAPQLPPRPPLLCAGCPHIATEFALRRLGFYNPNPNEELSLKRKIPAQLKKGGLIATSDIGCYTLGVYAPLFALDTCACMGASIGQALGLEKAGVPNKIVAVIGDSTFMHSGITGLIDVVYNEGSTTVIILDNETTAMTGHQGHPGTGISAKGTKAGMVKLEALARGIGVNDVNVVDAFDLALIESTLSRCIENDEPSVIIARGPCPLRVKSSGKPFKVDSEKCNSCYACLRIGCPAISVSGDKAWIDAGLCVGSGCGICAQVCPEEAISESKE
ncbi:MAG TPA: indolepyruvate ferredoxin oxidoreductase subunit alpha [Dehalococcoidia bacterium]|nr:indolepyruvate ferredoxin oxidoreductase subunit alpha [Dehalococcoidia bacterium]